MSLTFFAQNALGGLAYGSLLFLIASGLTLVFGLMRIINLAQTAFYLLGAYVGLTLVEHGMNFWLASAAAGVVTLMLGLAMYSAFLHRYHADPLTSLLLTLGFTLILDDQILRQWGGDPHSIAPPPMLASSLQVGTLIFPAYWLAVIGISVAIAVILLVSLQRTMLGVMIRAAVDDEEMARGVGVDVNRSFYIVFALGAFIAGLGGLLGGPITSAYPGLDGELTPLAFAVVIVGGMGSLTGALVGSLLIGLVNAFGKAFFPELSYFTIFVPVALIMAFRPQGLFGEKAVSLRRRWTVAAVAGLIVALLLPRLGVPTFYVSLLTQTWIFAIVAMSLDLLVGFTGLVNFSQAALFGVGAYTVAIAATRFHVTEFVPALLLGIVCAVTTAAIFGLIALRSEGVGFIIITIALNEIVWGLAYQWVSVSGGDNGITGIVRPAVGPFDVSANTGYYYVCLAFCALSLVLLLTIVRSPFGLVLRGVRETPRRMRALGYNVWLYRYLALLISGGFAGLAGVLFAWYNQFVGPVTLSLDQSTQILIMVILGGIGTLYGQVFGALLVVFLSNELSAVTQRWETVLGIVYIVVVMYAPGGLVGLVSQLWARVRGRRLAPAEPL